MLSWLTRRLRSSIGKKLVIAITGLLLVGFVIIHLLGNLLLFVGPQAYNEYAHKIHSAPELLIVAEVGLFALLFGHIYLAIAIALENRRARSTDYAMKISKIDTGALTAPASNFMVTSGLIVLVFLIVHLSDFKFELRNRGMESELPFDKAIRLLHDPVTFITYVVGSIVLGYHLSHGFQSAFHTLGLRHPKYAPIIRTLSILLALVVGLGFASFPVWATGIHGK